MPEETNKETGLFDLASLSNKVFHMRLCDDQVIGIFGTM